MPPTYDYKNLLDLGRVTYNNISQDDSGWDKGRSEEEQKKRPEGSSNEKNFLALATELINTLKSNSTSGNKKEESVRDGGKHTFLP